MRARSIVDSRRHRTDPQQKELAGALPPSPPGANVQGAETPAEHAAPLSGPGADSAGRRQRGAGVCRGASEGRERVPPRVCGRILTYRGKSRNSLRPSKELQDSEHLLGNPQHPAEDRESTQLLPARVARPCGAHGTLPRSQKVGEDPEVSPRSGDKIAPLLVSKRTR